MPPAVGGTIGANGRFDWVCSLDTGVGGAAGLMPLEEEAFWAGSPVDESTFVG